MVKEYVCSGCDKKCILVVDNIENNIEISGYGCDKGKQIGRKRFEDKKEILTTLVRIKGCYKNVIPVKSSEPIDIALHIECSKALSRLNVGVPIYIGDIVCSNILNTGIDILCVENVDKIP